MFATVQGFVQEWEQEAASTQKVLDALTDASLAREVAPGYRTLGEIAWHVAETVPLFASLVGLKIESAGENRSVPTSAAAIAAEYRRASQSLLNLVKSQFTDETMLQNSDMFGRAMPNGAILRMMLKHEIHHRGQLTVLMRQAGLKVPGVYGPSKDE
jgi:uncharacterized damage-inducible protein DinB